MPMKIVTSSPIEVGWVSFITWTTVPSCTLLRAPMRIQWTSPRTTAFIQIDEASPISTSPITCALASMNTLSWTRGEVPR